MKNIGWLALVSLVSMVSVACGGSDSAASEDAEMNASAATRGSSAEEIDKLNDANSPERKAMMNALRDAFHQIAGNAAADPQFWLDVKVEDRTPPADEAGDITAYVSAKLVIPNSNLKPYDFNTVPSMKSWVQQGAIARPPTHARMLVTIARAGEEWGVEDASIDSVQYYQGFELIPNGRANN